MKTAALINREFMKIWLPGESPWAEVLSHNPDGSRTVRIDNKVAGDYTTDEWRDVVYRLGGQRVDPRDKKDYRGHSHRFNDVVTVAYADNVWGVVPTVTH